MGAKKIAISIPEEVLTRVDKIAKKLNLSRSGYIASILQNVTNELEKAKTTERLNEIFKDEALLNEQKRVSDSYLSLESDEGEEW